MTRFGVDPQAFFAAIYQDTPPWDIGAEQPALTAMFADYPPAGPVLDVGCGSGDLAIALAARGLDVLGLDFAAPAIAQAEAKRRALPAATASRLSFSVGDALRPSVRQRRFGAIVDSGFFHLFDQPTRDGFAADLSLALRRGGRYYLLAFAIEFAMPNTPLKVTEEELRRRFSADRGWRLLDLRAVEFASRLQPVPAVAACVEFTGRD
jgi:SAM-dependent methyltransferase